MTKDHPFVRPKRPSLRPDLASARALRAGAVEDAACGTGEAGAKRPRRPRAQRYAHQPGTPSPLAIGGLPPRQKPLTIGGESPVRSEGGRSVLHNRKKIALYQMPR